MIIDILHIPLLHYDLMCNVFLLITFRCLLVYTLYHRFNRSNKNTDICFIIFTMLLCAKGASIIGGAIRPRLPGKLFYDVHGQTSRDLNPEAGLNMILYSDWL